MVAVSRCTLACVLLLAGCGADIFAPERFEFQTPVEKENAVNDSGAADAGLDTAVADTTKDSAAASKDIAAIDAPTMKDTADADVPVDAQTKADAGSAADGGPKDTETGDVEANPDASEADIVKVNPCSNPNATNPCDDGNVCSIGDKCNGGLCLPGAATTCNDKLPCTVDSCDKKQGCVFDAKGADGKPCDSDGDACTENDACTGGACKAGPVRSCSDGKPCTIDSCVAPAGKCTAKPTAEGGACSDGKVCTKGEACAAGTCTGGKPISCDDANACTTDSCAEPGGAHKGGCRHKVAPGPCHDGNACTVAAQCADGSCIVTKTGIPKGCDDGSPCTKEACSPKTGCVHLPVDGKCSDANACTKSDSCINGKCVGLPVSATFCDDANACTADSCDPKNGCVSKNIGGPCDDNDKCTVIDGCAGGKCVGIAVPASSCTDNNPCTEDKCDAKEGCVHAATHVPCDDTNPCTQQDICKNKTCAGTPLAAGACEDGNPCTKDSCDGAIPKGGGKPKGCVHLQTAGAACDDGDKCTQGDKCVGGKITATCVGAPIDATKTCDDGNVCTTDTCPIDQTKPGCKHAPAAGTCDDNNACTQDDACKSGSCAGTATAPGKLCDDGNVCTKDACKPGAKPGAACAHSNLDGAACDDANKCTTKDACAKGNCTGTAIEPKKACNDSNACTDDGCDPKTGCVHKANGAACDDGDPCTVSDACSAKVCAAGNNRDCNDANPCTTDSCNKAKSSLKTGCLHAFASGTCADANACTTSDRCVFGTCSGTPRSCDDGKPCTADSCDKTKGCVTQAKAGACNDGNPCTKADACSGGACVGQKLADGSSCADSAPCHVTATCKNGACTGAKAAANGTKCDDGNVCTAKDACQAGACKGTPDTCDDANLCTIDACVATKPASARCQHTPSKAAAACKDAGTCKQAVCQPTTGKCGHVDVCKPRIVLERSFDCGKPHGFTFAPAGAEPQIAWHVDGTPSLPGSFSKGCSLNFNDGKDYSNGKRALGQATSPAVALPHAPSPVLIFKSYNGVELNPKYDLRWVEVSDDGFAQRVERVRLDNSKMAAQWSTVQISLAKWRRKIIQVRFSFDSLDASSNFGPGWFIDDLRIEASLKGGSCQGHCGAYDAAAACQCDKACALYGDCCVDVQETCGGCSADADCDLGQPCAKAACDVANGLCAFTAAGAATKCNDNSMCTTADACQFGICAGKATACDDGQACTADSCDPKTGKCVFSKFAEGAACDDGDACTEPDACIGGACKSGKRTCDDGNSCTANGCDSTIGCIVKHLAIACEDGSLCTTGDRCESGACKSGAAAKCDDNNPCTADQCDGKAGSCQHVPRADGSACATGKTCIAGKCGAGSGACGNGKLEGGEQCDDKNTKAGDGCSATCQLETPEGMVVVPSGAFWMGCNTANESCAAAAKPQHNVAVSGFWIDVDEVSVDDYAKCMTAGKCDAPNPHNAAFGTLIWCNYKRSGAAQHPVNCVDWNQAATYCSWAGKRLPTEAEWEKAARGGCETLPGLDCKLSARKYPWGSAAPTCSHAVMTGTDAACANGGTAAVGGRDKGKSPYGVRDMLGNVAEWTSDWYDVGYYAKSPKSDPLGPSSTGKKAFRGGAWSYVPAVLRASMRFNFAVPNHRAATIGFRCARSLPN